MRKWQTSQEHITFIRYGETFHLPKKQFGRSVPPRGDVVCVHAVDATADGASEAEVTQLEGVVTADEEILWLDVCKHNDVKPNEVLTNER